MKKVITGSLFFLALFLGFFLSPLVVSCAPGLEPSWTAGKSGALCISLGGTGDYASPATDMPPATDARAIMGGKGLLYIQTGITAATAKVYGPYQAESGSTVNITDIPPGKYPEMAIFFLSSEPTSYMLPVIPDVPTDEGFLASARGNFSDAIELCSASSVAFVKDYEIVAGVRNMVQAVLIPTTGLSPDSDYNLTFPGSSSGLSRRFAHIDGLASRFGNVVPGSGTVYDMTFTNPTVDQLTLSAIGLYTEGGKRIFSQALNITLGASGQLSWPILWTGDDSYYLYAEFTGPSLEFNDSVNASAVTQSLSFVGNGGIGSVADISAAQGFSVTLPSGGFTRPGYAFLGWSTIQENTVPDYKGGDRYVIGAANQTLYAIWKPIAKEITITYYPNGGSGSMSPQNATEGQPVTLAPNQYTLTNNTFLGWSTIPSPTMAQYADGATITAGSTDLALYAVWKDATAVVSHTVTFNGNGGSGAMDPQSIVEGSAATLSANSFSRSGYVFLGWSLVAGVNTIQYADRASFAMGTSDVMLYAVWAQEITVSFDMNGVMTGSLSPVSGVEGKSIILPANTFTREGYTFLGWAHSASAPAAEIGNGDPYILGSQSETLYAVWKDTTAPLVSTFMIDDGAPGALNYASRIMTMYVTETGSGLRSITFGGDLAIWGAEVLSLNGIQLSTSFDSGTKTFTLNTPVTVTSADKLTFGFFSLTTGDAKKTVTAILKDNAGNACAQVSDSIFLDTQTPTMSSFTVRDAVTNSYSYATNSSLIITFTGEDATSGIAKITGLGGFMTLDAPIVKVNGVFVPSTSETGDIVLKTPVAGSASFEISNLTLGSSGDVIQSVSAKLADAAGNVSSLRSASITADLNKPTLSRLMVYDADGLSTDWTSGDVQLEMDFFDSFTGVSAVKITATGGTLNLASATCTRQGSISRPRGRLPIRGRTRPTPGRQERRTASTRTRENSTRAIFQPRPSTYMPTGFRRGENTSGAAFSGSAIAAARLRESGPSTRDARDRD